MINKQCFKCEQIKPLEEFYDHPMMFDGHLNKCKECTKSYVRKHRNENDSVREYDRERFQNNLSRRQKGAKNAREWRKLNPDGYAAHIIVNNAVRDGKLQKQPCQVCGSLKVHAHHKDYLKPLEVEWFCARHHSKQHNPDNF